MNYLNSIESGNYYLSCLINGTRFYLAEMSSVPPTFVMITQQQYLASQLFFNGVYKYGYISYDASRGTIKTVWRKDLVLTLKTKTAMLTFDNYNPNDNNQKWTLSTDGRWFNTGQQVCIISTTNPPHPRGGSCDENKLFKWLFSKIPLQANDNFESLYNVKEYRSNQTIGTGKLEESGKYNLDGVATPRITPDPLGCTRTGCGTIGWKNTPCDYIASGYPGPGYTTLGDDNWCTYAGKVCQYTGWPTTEKENCCAGNFSAKAADGKQSFRKCKLSYDHDCTGRERGYTQPYRVQTPEAWFPWTETCDDSQAVVDYCSQIRTDSPVDNQKSAFFIFDDEQCRNWANRSANKTRSDDILRKLCSDKNNAQDYGCGLWCSKPENENNTFCANAFKTFCKDKNLELPSCQNYCRSDNANCDEALTDYCSQTTVRNGKTEFVINEKNEKTNPKMNEICGCYRGTAFYDNYFNSFSDYTTSKDSEFCQTMRKAIDLCNQDSECRAVRTRMFKDSNCDSESKSAVRIPPLKECGFPKCSLSDAMPPYLVKKHGKQCPSTVTCIQNAVTLNYDSQIGNINNKQIMECKGVEQKKKGEQCTANQYLDVASNKCVDCKPGTEPNSEKTDCQTSTRCSNPREANINGKCTPCKFNEIPDPVTNKACIPCKETQRVSLKGDACIDIKPAPFQIIENNTAVSCPPKHTPVAIGKPYPNKCVECPPEKVINYKEGTCKKCDSGYPSRDGTKCVRCDEGSYYDYISSSCKILPPGAISNNYRNGYEICPPGHISQNDVCKMCPENTYAINNICTTMKPGGRAKLIMYIILVLFVIGIIFYIIRKVLKKR